MLRRGEIQANREAALIDQNPEKSEIDEGPKIAQPRTNTVAPRKIDGERDRGRDGKPKRNQGEGIEMPQRDFADDIVERPDEQHAHESQDQQQRTRSAG